MEINTALIDITDTVDLDREWEVPNWDYTAEIPPIPNTFGFHPDMWNDEAEAAEADYLAEVAAEQAYAEMLERRAERGTWWGQDDEGWY